MEYSTTCCKCKKEFDPKDLLVTGYQITENGKDVEECVCTGCDAQVENMFDAIDKEQNL